VSSRRPERPALIGIIGAVFIVGTGVASVLPVLPLFLRERGGSYALVGVVLGASLVVQFIGQYPAGLLSDGLAMLSLGIGFAYGVYNVVCSLFMKAIGATDWEVGLSLPGG